jgi:hypothetical protein
MLKYAIPRDEKTKDVKNGVLCSIKIES